MEKKFKTDEDRMIYQLELHRDTISWICEKLSKKNIRHERTRGNSAKGDILLISTNDANKVKVMIKKWHKNFNE